MKNLLRFCKEWSCKRLKVRSFDQNPDRQLEHARLDKVFTDQASGKNTDERLLPHLSPLGWEHINLTGDYIWQQNKQVGQGKFRPLRMPGEA